MADIRVRHKGSIVQNVINRGFDVLDGFDLINLKKGGLRGRSATGRAMSTRPVTGIDKAFHRGSLGSVKQLITRIDQFVSHYNENCKPFMWTASADSILEKLHRLCSRISGTEH